MKIEFTKEQHEYFATKLFQVITLHTVNDNSEVCCVIPVKENFTKDDMLIARIQAEKVGFKFNSDDYIESYNPKDSVYVEKTFCANYERDNLNLLEEFENKYIVGIDPFEVKCEDPIVEKVRQKLLDRSNVGVKKYNSTLKSNTKDNYLLHLQQEMLDGANYVETLLQQQLDITQLCLKYPNDGELGKEIRKIYGK